MQHTLQCMWASLPLKGSLTFELPALYVGPNQGMKCFLHRLSCQAAPVMIGIH